MNRSCIRLGLMLAAFLGLGARVAGAQTVHVGMSPVYQVVPINTDFEVDIQVLQSGPSFNAYDAIVTWDPAAVTFVPTSPLTLQEGSYMTGACSSRFVNFRQGTAQDTVAHSLLCNGISLTGPGQLYRLHFHTSHTPQLTSIHLAPGVQFYNAGILVPTTGSQDAEINIGNVTAVEAPAPVIALRLAASPNPSRGTTEFSAQAPAGARQLLVCSMDGRVVRRLAVTLQATNTGSVRWDGRDDGGRRVPTGVYVARLTVAGRSAQARVALLR